MPPRERIWCLAGRGQVALRALLATLVVVVLGQLWVLWPKVEVRRMPDVSAWAQAGAQDVSVLFGTAIPTALRDAYGPPDPAQCEPRDKLSNPRDRDAVVARAVRRVFGQRQLEVPPEGCGHASAVEVDFGALNARIKTPRRKRLGCIVYLAQKKHSSYKRDSLGMLTRSLDLLYTNYNAEFKHDVLIFHSGDFDAQDEADLRKNGTRKEIYVIEIPQGSRFWELPGFLDRSYAHKWTDDAFSEGYRHMCRWYSGRLFEFAERLSYKYVMRMDEDSYLLSRVRYNLFEFMQRRQLQYAYRLDAFEPCCDDAFRQQYIKAYLEHENESFFRSGFMKECCWDEKTGYSSYGYYNNFFITETGFWRQEHVKRLFSFVDWTGGFFLFRENDLVLQSLSVQLFMPKDKVHKFTDWSYAHVSGAACEWGAVVRGSDDTGGGAPVDDMIELYQRQNSKIRTVRSTRMVDYRWDAAYCAPENYEANVEVNFHQRAVDRVPSHKGKAPFCMDLLKHDAHDGAAGNYTQVQVPRMAPEWTGAELDDNPAHLAAKQAASRFRSEFDRLRTCSRSPEGRAMHAEPPECGAGCTLNYLVAPLMHAMSTGQAFLTPASLWASPNECSGSKSLSCFVRGFAERDDSIAGCAKASGPRFEEETGRWRRIEQDDHGQWSGIHKLARTVKGFEDFGIMWNVGQVLRNLLRLSPLVARQVGDQVRALGLDRVENQPVLGLHVRLGDACSDPKLDEKGRRCDPLSYYMPAVKILVAKYGFKSIYLATDSAQVLREAQEQYGQYMWLFNDAIDRSRYEVFARASQKDEVTIEGVLFGDERLRKAGFTRTQEMVDFLVDTMILGVHTSGFVGKFTSNMDRIVTALGAATGNDAGTCLKPTISLDSDWCFDFMVQSGVGLDGKLFYC